MSRFSLREIAEATGALLLQGRPEAQVAGLSIDTRTLQPGQLFVALKGEQREGNDFAGDAAQRGAGALLLRSDGRLPAGLPAGVPILLHEDPRRALGDLATWHRSRLSAAVVGITGSAGKTTTKNMLRELLDGERRVVASDKSFNNDIGLPLSILAAGSDTDVLVLEIGSSAPGEIAALCAIARPTIGVVTGVGHAHLERLGSLEGVAREKAALPAALPSDGLCVLNADCRFLSMLRASTRARVLTCSVGASADLTARELVFHAAGTSFKLGALQVTLPLLGTHNVSNLLLALGACQGLGVDLSALLPRIARLQGGKQRLEWRELGGLTLIDDSYNANPDSARAALRVLAGLHGYGRRVLVLGDMLELGERAGELHKEFGAQAAQAGLDLFVCVGPLALAAAAGAGEAGLAPASVLHFDATERAAAELPGLLRDGDVVLLKASRRMAFERIVERLVAARGRAADAASSPRGSRGREVCTL